LASRRSLSLRGPLVGRARRSTAWGIGPGSGAAVSFTAGGASLVGAVAVPTVEGLTVVRIRGYVELLLTAVSAAGDGFTGALGLGIAPATATAAGIASIPTPLTEEDSDNWLWFQYFSVHATAASITGLEFIRFQLDTKAMRKFPAEQALYLAVEVIEIGTSAITIFGDSRLLVKLS